MDPSYVILVLVGALIVCGIVVLRLQHKVLDATREKIALEGEEHRMLDFLHLLGLAIEDDYTPRKLYRMIVEGVEEVIDGDGSALYLLSGDGKDFVPAHLTAGCPPLMVFPKEVVDKLLGDQEGLLSYLRLVKCARANGLPELSLSSGESLRIADLRTRSELAGVAELIPENTEVMISPMKHGGRALGVLVVARTARELAFNRNDFDVFRAMAEQSAFALGNALVHQEVEEKRQLDRELHLARAVQRVLLPAEDPAVPGYRIYGTNVPARIISGDYYDYIPLEEGRFGVAIADVSGKGASAGLLMATCRSSLRAVAGRNASPGATLAAVNRQIFSDMKEDMFISMAYLVLQGSRIVLARAGHDAPLLFRQSTGEVEVLKPGGLALGVDDGPVFERVTKEFEGEMEKGDCLLLYTDGVNEGENVSGEEFGKDRMREEFRKLASSGAERVVSGLQQALGAFVGEARQNDDITMIAIEKR